MSLITRKAFLETVTPFLQIKRFRGKINIKKPKPPHFERSKYIELTRPYFLNPNKNKPMIDLCTKSTDKVVFNANVDNPYQRIVARELLHWLQTSRLVIFYHLNPMTGEQQYKSYAMFKKENMYLKTYGKKTMELAVKGTPYEVVLDFYVSRNVMLFSPDNDIKKILKITKKFNQLTVLAAIYDGKFISKDELLEYSLIPNLQMAQASLVQTLNNVGGGLVGHLNSHQNSLVSNLQERIKQLEDNK